MTGSARVGTSAGMGASTTGSGVTATVFFARGLAVVFAGALLAPRFAGRADVLAAVFGSVWAAVFFAPRLEGVVLVMSVPVLSVPGTVSVFFVFGMYVPGHSGRARGG
ncbi:hypothetical protein SY84_05180 [Deinococcus soli (ex Cha et al. 2016)]|uniref:Uncharacterized protein n=1 Tax=Deinococcus soli (ex Cha et al. 2016) TaxID=1309411 RepID=A0A0F7JK67_9DEIO|nr:hypothetical protein SY84_05180 [Deinococcus soli (ex Cha et al. 2016)]